MIIEAYVVELMLELYPLGQKSERIEYLSNYLEIMVSVKLQIGPDPTEG